MTLVIRGSILGANIDAVSEAGKFGIREDRAVRYENDSVGTSINYEVINQSVKMARKSASMEEMAMGMSAPEFLNPIRKYHEKKNQK